MNTKISIEEKELLSAISENNCSVALEKLTKKYMPLVIGIANRYRGRGPQDDLIQVGSIGLIKSLRKFEIERGYVISTYAAPMIDGEIKRYFRDFGKMLKVPRALLRLSQELDFAKSELFLKNKRKPTAQELAEYLDIPLDDVLIALNVHSDPLSLDSCYDVNDDDSGSLSDTMGDVDAGYSQVETRMVFQSMIDHTSLTEDEKKILYMRFYEGLSQNEMAGILGISQMHVSRLIRRVLHKIEPLSSEDNVTKPSIKSSDRAAKLSAKKLSRIRPTVNEDDPRIQSLSKVIRMSKKERLLVALWRFGESGTDRFSLRWALDIEEDKNLRLKPTPFSQVLAQAEKGKLVYVHRHETSFNNDFIIPRVSLDVLMNKYLIRCQKPKPAKAPRVVPRKKLPLPGNNDERIGRLLQKDLTYYDRIVLMLWRFHSTNNKEPAEYKGVERWALRENMKLEKGGLYLSGRYFATRMVHAKGKYISVQKMGCYNLDLIFPLVSIDELMVKYGLKSAYEKPSLKRRKIEQQLRILIILWDSGGFIQRSALKEALKTADEKIHLSGPRANEMLCRLKHRGFVDELSCSEDRSRKVIFAKVTPQEYFRRKKLTRKKTK